jgi:uncharacterized protein (DUF305 family)
MIVSHQGTKLSAGQQLRMLQQAHVRSFMNPVLKAQVEETIQLLDKRKEEGAKPERQWFPHSQSTGTISIAEYMGF